MPRMLQLIRASAVTSNVMQSASKGSLALPPAEMLEIMVYLAENNKIFGQQAKFTLASWDENACKAAASDPKTSKEVLDYFISPHNLRPAILPSLLENPSVPNSSITTLAETATRDICDILLKSPRVQRTPQILQVLKENKNVTGLQTVRIEQNMAPAASEQPATEQQVALEHEAESGVAPQADDESVVEVPADGDPAIEDAVTAFVAQHSAEISAEGAKPFQPIGGILDELEPSEEDKKPETAPGEHESKPHVEAHPHHAAPKKAHLSHDEERGSALQKISKLDVKGRIQLAMKGTKEERSILVRDGTKLVALAVLDSPKITDGEVEKFASQKNVLEAVLRQIPMKRRFAKNYIVVRNLVFNPRTPLDLSLGLMKNLLVQDLKNLAGNKEVSETIRKLGLKMFKQKMETKKG